VISGGEEGCPAEPRRETAGRGNQKPRKGTRKGNARYFNQGTRQVSQLVSQQVVGHFFGGLRLITKLQKKKKKKKKEKKQKKGNARYFHHATQQVSPLLRIQ